MLTYVDNRICGARFRGGYRELPCWHDPTSVRRNNNTPALAGCMESMREIPVVSARNWSSCRIAPWLLSFVTLQHIASPPPCNTTNHCVSAVHSPNLGDSFLYYTVANSGLFLYIRPLDIFFSCIGETRSSLSKLHPPWLPGYRLTVCRSSI